MALFMMIIRKMIKNKWLELSLVLGLVLSVALISSMPIYTDAILQRMLVKDLEHRQIETEEFSGIYTTSVNLPSGMQLPQRKRLIQLTDEYMADTVSPGLALPQIYYVRERATDRYVFTPSDPELVDPDVRRIADIGSLSGLEDIVTLIDGRFPASEPVDGVYEAIVLDSALDSLSMMVGHEFTVKSREELSDLQVKTVGTFKPAEGFDLYFSSRFNSSYGTRFFMNFDLFEGEFVEKMRAPIRASNWRYALDYSEMDLRDVASFLETWKNQEIFMAQHYDSSTIYAPITKMIEPYLEREQRLRTLLWSLNVPVIIMLSFYLFMVSNLIISRQKTEISVLRSRGASRLQIMAAFTIEGVILGGLALAVGPHIGLYLTKMLGAANGFLEFVNRSPLLAELNAEAYQYALITVLCSLIMTLIPAFMATRVTIVEHKQKMARTERGSFWHKYFIDIILIALSLYGLNNFYRTLEDMQRMGLDTLHFRVDPMLFLIPALFILGLGLFILRVYPWFVSLVYWLGRKWWSATLYSSLIQVARSSRQYQYIMIFLIMTIATGLFSASAARTINQNVEEQIQYAAGADLVMSIRWENDAPPPPPIGPGGVPATEPLPTTNKRIQYSEPPFLPFTQLPGVEHAAKVFVQENAAFRSTVERGKVKLMAIDTDDFGHTSWFKHDLLDHHLNLYLNLISQDPQAVLISRSLAEQKDIAVGDEIQLNWSGLPERQFIVYGIIDYFPTFNPFPEDQAEGKGEPEAPMLVVAHLERVQNYLALEPYDIWLKLAPDASRQEIREALQEQKIPVLNIIDTRGEVSDAKNDPFQLAVNGVMTLGFIISVLISFCGFLLYWILSLISRILQLGIYRAMGVSFKHIVIMLTSEQLLTSGAAVVIGVLTGHLTSRLFVPLFQLAFDPTEQVPPFAVAMEASDSMQLYIIVTMMIVLGLLILSIMTSRIKLHQAVKLGED